MSQLTGAASTAVADAAAYTAAILAALGTRDPLEVLRTTPSQPTEVVVRGWDPKRKEAIVGQSQRSEAGPELEDTNTGGEVVKNLFNMEAPMTVSREDIATQAAADRMAHAISDELQSGFTTAEGSSTGDPNLRPGAEVKISGVGAFEGGRIGAAGAGVLGDSPHPSPDATRAARRPSAARVIRGNPRAARSLRVRASPLGRP